MKQRAKELWALYGNIALFIYAVASTVGTLYIIKRMNSIEAAESTISSCEARVHLLECIWGISRDCGDWRY
jgi:hypothetical protein